MLLDDKHISAFQELYKKNFGEDISKEEAYTQGIKLIELVRVVYQPMTKEEYDLVQQETL
jgi:hypothetical protein